MSERQSYDLLNQRWIRVVRGDGTLGRVSIRCALNRAHDFRNISHSSPFIEFGLYRLLITIALDACIVSGKRPTVGTMKEMLNAGKFNAEELGAYLDRLKDRFDLWGERYPFLQLAGLDHGTNAGKPEAISKMIAPVPSGTKITFWHHYGAQESILSPEDATMELCAAPPFCFDYAPKDICTIGGDPPLYTLVMGDSLFETIVYNLPRPTGRLTTRQELDGGPSWRCPVSDASALPRSPTHAQAWTWPVRQIRLVRSDSSSLIAEAINIAGAGKTPAKERVRGWRDPNAGTITDGARIHHIRGRAGMLLWRDFVPLFLIGSEGETLRGDRIRSRPEVVTNALRVADDKQLRLAVYGFIDKGGKNNKVFRDWFRTVLAVPTEVARDNRLSARAVDAFKTTQKVADSLQAALRMLRPPVKASKNKRPPPGRGESDLLASFWQSLEPALSHSYLQALASGASKAEDELRERIRKEARDAFGRATGPHRRTADGLFRIANGRNWLERRLARLLPTPPQERKP